MIITKEECVFLAELTLGKPVTCKLAAVSVTAVIDPDAWPLSLVLKLSSPRGMVMRGELVSHCLLFVTTGVEIL